MKKLALITLAVLLQSINLYSQIYISDQQSSIGKDAIEGQKYPPAERKIVIDTINNTAKIELPSGKIVYRTIKFFDHLYENYGVFYNGYYKTNKDEALYVRENDIFFNATNTLGYAYGYTLKDAKQPTDEEKKKYDEIRAYENALSSYGRHTANCVRRKIVQKGINTLALNEILESKPIYVEYFNKNDSVVEIYVYKNKIIRGVNLEVDKVIDIK